MCFKETFSKSGSLRIPNTKGQRPKTFEIDCLIDDEALEIKWKDATADGDHITKQHTRIQVIADAGYTPTRVMFYYPNRTQTIRIQETLESLYKGMSGKYYYDDAAWDYVEEKTAINLKKTLEMLAVEYTGNAQ